MFCLVNYFYLIPTQVIRHGSSANYPYMVITFLFIFVLVYTFLSFKKRISPDSNYINISFSNKQYIFKNFIILLMMIFYVCFIESFGFILISFLFILIAMMVYGLRDYFRVLIISILFPTFISYIFRILLKSNLPGGIIEQIIFGW